METVFERFSKTYLIRGSSSLLCSSSETSVSLAYSKGSISLSPFSSSSQKQGSKTGFLWKQPCWVTGQKRVLWRRFLRDLKKSFSRKESMKRHINNRHSNPSHFSLFYAMYYSAEKCQRFKFEHLFTCMVACMRGSEKTVLAHPLLTQTYRMINLPPEKIVWCYSQWQPA